MKKQILSLVMAASAFTLVGCKTTNMSQASSPLTSVVHADLKADIAVGEDITGTSSATVILSLFKVGADSKFADGVNYAAANQAAVLDLGLGTVPSMKALTIYIACNANGADVLVAPRYVVNIQDYLVFKKITVTVKGKKGTIGAIR